MCLTAHTHCASGSVGGARPCQGRGRGFESRLALSKQEKGYPKWISFFRVFKLPEAPIIRVM